MTENVEMSLLPKSDEIVITSNERESSKKQRGHSEPDGWNTGGLADPDSREEVRKRFDKIVKVKRVICNLQT